MFKQLLTRPHRRRIGPSPDLGLCRNTQEIKLQKKINTRFEPTSPLFQRSVLSRATAVVELRNSFLTSNVSTTFLTADITNTLEPSPSSEATSRSATQKFLSNFWNQMHQCRVHESPPMVPILRQINPVRNTSFCLSKIYFNISPIYVYALLVISFLLAFQPKSCMQSSSHPCVLQAIPILDLIILIIFG
jgi:hypothetical protein